MRQRHPLDHSPERISDLPPEAQRRALLCRGEQARAAWLRNREQRPIIQRLTSLLRGTPPAPGEAAGACPPRAGGAWETR